MQMRPILAAGLMAFLAAPGAWADVVPVERVEGEVLFHGLLVDEQARPIGGVKYQVYRWQWPQESLETEGLTRADGSFDVGPAASDEEGRVARMVFFDVPGKGWAWRAVDDRTLELYLRGLRVIVKPAAPVAGVVKDEHGAPVPGALVDARVRDETFGYLTPGPMDGRAVTTDAAGRFLLDRIPAGARVSLHVRSAAGAHSMIAAYGFDVYPVRAGMQDVELVVRPAGEVRVQLMAAGKALERAGVWLEAGEAQRRELPVRLKTDARGVALFAALEPGQWTFSGGRQPELTEGVLMTATTPVGRGQTRTLALDVVRGGEVHGRLLDLETQRGIPGMVEVLQAGRPLRPVYAAPDGAFNLRLPAGEYALESYGSEGGQGKTYRQAVKVVDGEAAALELPIHARAMLKGQLLDESGKPLAGIVVARSTALLTDDAGRFALEARNAGEDFTDYGVAMNRNRTLGRGFVLTGKEHGELRLELAPMGSLEGRIVDAAGNPAPDAEVSLGIRALNGGWDSPGMWVWERTVSKDGRFRFAPVPPGLPVDLMVNRRTEQALVKLGDLAPGDDRDVANVVLHERGAATQTARPGAPVDTALWDGQIAGRVVDEKGQPLVGASVYPRLPTGGGTGDETDIHGGFVVKGVPREGAAELFASLDRRSGSARLEPGKGRQLKILPQAFELLGKPAPALLIENWIVAGPAGKDGQGPASWQDFRGKVVLLHAGVWRKRGGSEVELVKGFLERHRAQGLEAVTVHIDQDAEPGELKAYAERFGIDWAFGVDADPRKVVGLQGRTENGALESLLAGPGFFLVDKLGILRAAPGWREMDDVIEKLLAE